MADHGFRDYRTYVKDTRLAKLYGDYQKKYATEPRESDKMSARLVMAALREMQPLDRRPRLLDIGCSTGNFLLHLKRILPGIDLTGGDLMQPVIDGCRANPDLEGIRFEIMDVFNIPDAEPFDVITANAVNVYFEPDEYERALVSIRNALRPGGAFIAYEWVFPGDREQRIVETSEWHPDGLKFWFRSEDFMRGVFDRAGFADLDIRPFEIPIDLPKPESTGTDMDLVTYTTRDPATNRRLMWRGALYQPWCHVVARNG